MASKSRLFATALRIVHGVPRCYGKAWAPYVWPVSGVDDLRVAPFHLLASEGRVWFDHDHVWLMKRSVAEKCTHIGGE